MFLEKVGEGGMHVVKETFDIFRETGVGILHRDCKFIMVGVGFNLYGVDLL